MGGIRTGGCTMGTCIQHNQWSYQVYWIYTVYIYIYIYIHTRNYTCYPCLSVLCIFNSVYENPEPSKKEIRNCVNNYRHAVAKSLNLGSDRDNTIRCHFRHDVYRYLFKDRTELNFDDFDSTYFYTRVGGTSAAGSIKELQKLFILAAELSSPLQ